MNRSDLREALLAEALGDAGKVLDGVERLLPTLNATHHVLADTATELTQRIAEFKPHIVAVSSHATEQALKVISQTGHQAVLRSQQRSEEAMRETARAMFESEANRALARFTRSAAAIERRSASGAWDGWVTHCCAALVGALCMWGATTWLGAG